MMEWLWLAFAISGGLNYYLWGELQETEVRENLFKDAASACQAAKSDSRKLEIEASNERRETESTIRGIISRSKFNDRGVIKMGGDSCAGAIFPNASGFVDKHRKRAKDINSEWVRDTSESNE